MKAVVNGTAGQGAADCCKSEIPNPDAVRVWLTERIYEHFEYRGAFPGLRHGSRSAWNGIYSLHWCDQATALAVLQDAKGQLVAAKGWMKNALHALIRGLESEIDEARFRRKWLEGAAPKSLHISERSRKYVATHSQLGALEVPPDLPLPGTLGGPARKATFQNAAGMRCTVLRADRIWSGCFFVNIEVPPKPRPAAEDEELDKLRSAPQTAAKFLEGRLRALEMASAIFPVVVGSSSTPGFSFSAETISRFQSEVSASFARLRSVLERGEVVGDGPQQMIRERQAVLAKQDRKLQGFLRIVHSGPGS